MTWHRCWNDPTVWRMLEVRPDRELLVVVDAARAKLLSFELEWEDGEGRRRYLTWGSRKGFELGVVEPEPPSSSSNGLSEFRVPSKHAPDGEILGTARRIVESTLGRPVSDWILELLAA